jgi:ABC-type transport system involved in multi-copper enzyme maturation permease subunit
MPVFALFHRALTIDARGLAAYILRGGLLLGLMVAVVIAQHSELAAPGLSLLKGLAWCNLIFLIAAAVPIFATAISEEREGGTLGLLRTSQLSVIAILLGKSGSSLIIVLLVQVAQLPFLLFAITLGGITVEQVLAVFVLLASYTVLLAAVGLLCSVFSSSNNRAISVTIVPALAGAIFVGHEFGNLWIVGQPRSQLANCATLLGLAGACLLIALQAFHREATCERQEEGGQREPIPIGPKEDPITWKEYHFQCGVRGGRYFKLGLAVVLFFVGRTGWLSTFEWSLAFAALVVMEFGYQVTAIFGEEYAQGTLGMLYALPQGRGTVFDRKFNGRLRAIIPIYLIGAVLLGVIFPAGYGVMMGIGFGLAFVLIPYGMLCALLSLYVQRHPTVIAGLSLGLLFAVMGITVLPVTAILPAFAILWAPCVYIGLCFALAFALRDRLAEVTGGRRKDSQQVPPKLPPPLPR